ncbi:MAG: hypothetical protein IJR99_10165, partial [Kiritimatiellae bacterium]|nr:hypothetical protein [Kiritimatiellia bacterium]
GVFIHLTQMVKRRFHSFLLTDIHLCDLCVLCGKKYRGGEVSTEEYRFKAKRFNFLKWEGARLLVLRSLAQDGG